MTNVGAPCNFLKASAELKAHLRAAGGREKFSAGHALFREDERNIGVFLLLKGRIRMSVRGLPKLDRVFPVGSVLGLPSTFTGRNYSLTAEAITEVDVVHVPGQGFLQLMRDRADLCRETTEMLGREVSFIQAALAERRKEAARNKLSPAEVGALI